MQNDDEQFITDDRLISRKEAIIEVRKACYHFSDLYFHFSKVLIEEYGIEKGKELIERAVRNRAIERAGNIIKNAERLGVPRNKF